MASEPPLPPQQPTWSNQETLLCRNWHLLLCGEYMWQAIGLPPPLFHLQNVNVCTTLLISMLVSSRHTYMWHRSAHKLSIWIFVRIRLHAWSVNWLFTLLKVPQNISSFHTQPLAIFEWMDPSFSMHAIKNKDSVSDKSWHPRLVPSFFLKVYWVVSGTVCFYEQKDS